MNFGKYCFYCSMEKEAQLPVYKGSTFRGVFGLALKKTVCALKHQECTDCLLNQTCIYSRVFETRNITIPAGLRITAYPHPFVIIPPLTQKTRIPSGSSFDFELLLFGEVNNHLPYFIYAFDTMGAIGIGKKTGGKRPGFTLNTVQTNNEIIYSNKDRKLNTPKLKKLDIASANTLTNQTKQITINIETPLRLKFKNRLQQGLPFHILIRAMLRRVSTLFTCYGKGEPDLDYKGLVNRAKSVEIKDSTLTWFDWKRYSSRQDQTMLMGGITGSVTYQGDLDEFIPLIKCCENLHLGKQTAFGLGKFSVWIEKKTAASGGPAGGQTFEKFDKRVFYDIETEIGKRLF